MRSICSTGSSQQEQQSASPTTASQRANLNASNSSQRVSDASSVGCSVCGSRSHEAQANSYCRQPGQLPNRLAAPDKPCATPSRLHKPNCYCAVIPLIETSTLSGFMLRPSSSLPVFILQPCCCLARLCEKHCGRRSSSREGHQTAHFIPST
ncbi:hypothetical protein BD289DRAFT_165628 [Coniella lustricola]|uniref:Uncharacterized protein n=1 Tax=Coniella lustricola TaxID=2025994 RepID=A0A2T2ZUA4_9PEZI|nr:hypothetical protein BD289DRAFT_165628 [Coniella lustricola]